jgi:hypothetical protein
MFWDFMYAFILQKNLTNASKREEAGHFPASWVG